MIQLEPRQFGSLRSFVPDQPEATLPVFCLENGLGEAYVDDLATPRNLAVLLPSQGAGSPGKAFLYGMPGSDDLRRLLENLEDPTEVFCSPELSELVVSLAPDATPKEYLVYHFDRIAEIDVSTDVEVRRLRVSDTGGVSRLLPVWAWGAFDSVRDMILSGAVYGVLEGDGVVSAAFLTDTSVKYETLAAVTAESHRRRGYAYACARRLMVYSLDRAKLPRAITPVRHEAGISLGARLGFPASLGVTSYFLDGF